MSEKSITCTIDGKSITVPEGTTVYTACKELGIDIPIFCYQDRMPPFGACRVCLVQVEKMGKLQSSCTLEATEGMVVNTQAEAAVKGREEILEFLLINHPLDCPICDRAGECPLQDHVYDHGPGRSRFYETKRHFKKALPLGPVLMLDRERCIACARCTRFCETLAGDHALEFKDRGYETEIGTPNNGPAESKFIGNTIMLCPVGALTSDVYRFRARPWDNVSTPSSCTLCPVGCSLYLDQRDGEILRTRSLENKAINDIWLCDKGWFGYEFTDNPKRLDFPLIREGDHFREASWDEALSVVADRLFEAKESKKIAGFGGNNLTIQENSLFQSLIKEVVGVPHLDYRIGMPLFSKEEEGVDPGMSLSLEACEELETILIFGLDLTEEFPLIWLRLRQAINKGAKVLFLGHYAPEIAPYFTETILHAPGEEMATIDREEGKIKDLLKNGKKAALFLGRQYLVNQQRLAILQRTLELIEDQPLVSLNLMEGQGNSYGARLAAAFSNKREEQAKGLNYLEVLQETANNGWDFLYVVGSDLVKKYPYKEWKKVREKLKFLVVQDLFLTETAREADIVLPVLSHLEKEGSFLTLAGALQKIHPGKKIPDHLLSDGEIFRKLARKLNSEISIPNDLKELLKGEKIDFSSQKINISKASIKKEQNQGGLKASFRPVLFDSGVRMSHNPHLSQMKKPGFMLIHPNEAKKQGVEGSEKVLVRIGENEIEGAIKTSRSVAEGTLLIPLGVDEISAENLGSHLMNGALVTIRRLSK